MDGDSHIQNLTQSMQEILSQSGIMDGTLTLFVKHTTAAVMIIEDEPGIRADTRNFWNRCSVGESLPPRACRRMVVKHPSRVNRQMV